MNEIPITMVVAMIAIHKKHGKFVPDYKITEDDIGEATKTLQDYLKWRDRTIKNG